MAPRTFIHREFQPKDPAFLQEERQFVQRQWGVWRGMQRGREHLTSDIERARSLAAKAGIRVDRELAHEERRLLALIGIGNRQYRDDAAGIEVVRRLRLAHPPGLRL